MAETMTTDQAPRCDAKATYKSIGYAPVEIRCEEPLGHHSTWHRGTLNGKPFSWAVRSDGASATVQ